MRELTRHASVRAQQRGIPRLVVDWLEAYGEEMHDQDGTIILHFSKRSRRRLERDVGREPVRRLSNYLRCYVVVSNDGAVITVGHRHKHICRR